MEKDTYNVNLITTLLQRKQLVLLNEQDPDPEDYG